jgi:hypothetical protein
VGHVTRVEETENECYILIRKHHGRDRDVDGRMLLRTITGIAFESASCIEMS